VEVIHLGEQVSLRRGDGRGPLDAEVRRLQGDDDEEYDDDRRKSNWDLFFSGLLNPPS